MRILLLLILSCSLLTACTKPPLNPYSLQDLKVGQTRDHVLAQVNQSPEKVVHTSFDGDDYIAYFYHLQTGTKTSTICSTPISCHQTKEPVSVPYLFIFKGSNQPRLEYFNTLEKLKKSPLARQRNIVKQIQLTTPIPRNNGN